MVGNMAWLSLQLLSSTVVFLWRGLGTLAFNLQPHLHTIPNKVPLRGPGFPREPFLSIQIPFLYPRKLKIRSCRGEYISENSNFCTSPENGPAQESSYALQPDGNISARLQKSSFLARLKALFLHDSKERDVCTSQSELSVICICNLELPKILTAAWFGLVKSKQLRRPTG